MAMFLRVIGKKQCFFNKTNKLFKGRTLFRLRLAIDETNFSKKGSDNI